MDTEKLVNQWFECWEKGAYHKLPLTDEFVHKSPYGTIKGKQQYLEIVKANLDKFLGHSFKIHDEIYLKDKACVQYTGSKNNFELDVSEWYYFEEEKISKIVAYYNIEGAISEQRQLTM